MISLVFGSCRYLFWALVDVSPYHIKNSNNQDAKLNQIEKMIKDIGVL